jgi:DinB superfamily
VSPNPPEVGGAELTVPRAHRRASLLETVPEPCRPRSLGPFTVDFAFPQPDPPPVTTIAWRLAHVIVGVFGMRAASHFGGPPVSYEDFAYAGTATEALLQLDETHDAWISGVRGLDAEALARPVRLHGAVIDRPAGKEPRSRRIAAPRSMSPRPRRSPVPASVHPVDAGRPGNSPG